MFVNNDEGLSVDAYSGSSSDHSACLGRKARGGQADTWRATSIKSVVCVTSILKLLDSDAALVHGASHSQLLRVIQCDGSVRLLSVSVIRMCL